MTSASAGGAVPRVLGLGSPDGAQTCSGAPREDVHFIWGVWREGLGPAWGRGWAWWAWQGRQAVGLAGTPAGPVAAPPPPCSLLTVL